MAQPLHQKAPLILIDSSILIFIGHLHQGSEHRHAAAALLLALEKPLEVKLKKNGVWTAARSAVIPADCRHWLDPKGGLTAVIYSDIYDPRYSLMGPHAITKPMFDLPFTDELASLLIQQYKQGKPSTENSATLDQGLYTALGKRTGDLGLDPRVNRAIEIMRSSIGQSRFTQEHIAALLNISSSRLQHLFRQELGVGFSRLQAWLKLRIALIQFTEHRSVTHAALDADFGSSSHFSHTFRAMFGVSLREIQLFSSETAIYELKWQASS